MSILSKITMVYHIKNTVVFWGGTFTFAVCSSCWLLHCMFAYHYSFMMPVQTYLC